MKEHSKVYQQEELSILRKIEVDPSFILTVENPNNDELEMAFDLQPDLALHFPGLPEYIQMFLVKTNPEYLKFIAEPTSKVEQYVVSRGFLDHRNGEYYWNKIDKSPTTFWALLKMFPSLTFQAYGVFLMIVFAYSGKKKNKKRLIY